MSTELVQLHKMPLLRILDFTLRPEGSFAYADLSAPVFVCGKPLDLEESDRRLAHLGKRPQAKAVCIVDQCNKRFRHGEDLYTHLLEHPEFAGKSVDEQEELMSRIISEYLPASAPYVASTLICSLSLVSPDAPLLRTIGQHRVRFYIGEVPVRVTPRVVACDLWKCTLLYEVILVLAHEHSPP